MAAKKILVVEDEASLRETLSYNLMQQGYEVSTAQDGREGLRLARQEKPDLIVMDVMLPELDGMEVTRILRAESNVPILMLTARHDELDRVLGLEVGADDYLSKPFSMRELLARVKAMLRRVRLMEESAETDAPDEELAFGNLSIDPARHEARLGGKPLALKPKEYELLLYLARHRGQVLSRDAILENVWGWDFSGGSRTVDVHIRWLRSKVEPEPDRPRRIVTVRGAGYMFEE